MLHQFPKPPDGRTRKILCVDDESAIRDILAMALRQKGFAVDVASDGSEAWERLSADLDGVDLVVTDNQVPMINGIELVQLLREANYAGKIVFFSSSLKFEDAARIKALGTDAIVEKGSALDRLLTEIARVMA